MPAPPPPPPAPTFNLGGGSADQGRGALLQSIRAGKPLKKTVTVDKSAPAISGKVKGESSSTSSTPNVNTRSNASVGNSINNGNPMGLGGLFAGGMPKLKPTGMRNNLAERDNGNGSAITGSATLPNVKRGPPPVPPPATQKPQIFPQNAPQSMEPSANHNTDTPRSSFGKPTLAPKPPTSSNTVQQKPSPPPKKLNLTTNNSVSRAQSMRIPRSPPVLAPTPPSLHQSQDCLNEPLHRPMTRVLRPPQARPPSPPTSRAPSVASIASNGGPPITRVAPPPPARAPSMPPPPPPLPHRTVSAASGVQPQNTTATTTRQAPPVPPPPTPPTRGQSLQSQRNGHAHGGLAEFEARFTDMFHSIHTFPAPEPFRNLPKVYNSKTAAAAKQQAPMPPTRSVSNAGATLHSPGSRQQPPQPPQHQQQHQQQWYQQQQHSNAASSAC